MQCVCTYIQYYYVGSTERTYNTSINKTANVIVNSVQVALITLESACETLGLADALEPNPTEDEAIARWLAQDEADMAYSGVRDGIYR